MMFLAKQKFISFLIYMYILYILLIYICIYYTYYFYICVYKTFLLHLIKAWEITLIFLEISSLSHSIVFLYFFPLITEEGFLSLLAILWNSAFKWVYLSFSPLLFASLLLSVICKVSSDNHFDFLHFFFLGMILIPVSCTMSRTFIHSSSSTLSIRSSPLNLFLTSIV